MISILKTTIISFILLFSVSAHAVIDDQAQTVQLKTRCTVNAAALDNCFETTKDLRNWMSATRHPNASAPLEVQMGPGKFGRLAMTCDPASGYTGHVSFNGAGSEQSQFEFSATGNPPYGVLTIKNCTAMAFNNLKVSSGTAGFAYGYIQWQGGGTSRWSNVDVVVSARGWEETDCGTTKGQHYWFGSRYTTHAVANIGTGYKASCDDSWFFGSEITFTTQILGIYGGGSNGSFNTLVATNNTELHVYGSVIRALSTAGNQTGNMTAVSSSAGSKVHLHGTGIDVVVKDDRNAVALSASSGATIHANQSSYFMTAPTGTVTRIANNGGTVRAPYLWEEGATPPNVTTTSGADMAVITATTDGQPHMVISSANCASGWFDTVTAKCYP